MVERCVEFTPMTRAAYVADDESFGLRKMFAEYGFALNLQPKGNARTSVRVDTHYAPRNPLFHDESCGDAPTLRAVVDSVLAGSKTLSEERTPTFSYL